MIKPISLSPIVAIMVLASMALLAVSITSCASSPKEPKEWEPQLDQFFQSPSGQISFARTHYALSAKESMNRLRENQIKSFMKKTCKEKKVAIIRKYKTESDFVSLKHHYTQSLPIVVFEFNCL